MITQEYLKSVVDYCPDTGAFTLKVNSQKTAAGGSPEHKNFYGYRIISLPGNKGSKGFGQHPSHRMAYLYMTGTLPEGEVDHINGIRDDNRWANLRNVTSSENKRNCARRSDNTSGCVGVSFHKKRNQWRARIGARHLGWFKTKEEATSARMGDSEYKTFSERHGT